MTENKTTDELINEMIAREKANWKSSKLESDDYIEIVFTKLGTSVAWRTFEQKVSKFVSICFNEDCEGFLGDYDDFIKLPASEQIDLCLELCNEDYATSASYQIVS